MSRAAPQSDLFAPLAAPLQVRLPARPITPPPPDLAALLPRRPHPAWQRHLDAAGAVPLELMVFADWTGVVIEVLSLPGHRLFLTRDGQILDNIPPDGRSYRAAFLTPAETRKLAARQPLALLGPPGTGAIRLTTATTSPAWTDLPDWLDGIEAAAKP